MPETTDLDPVVRRARRATFVAFFLQGSTLATIVTRIPAFKREFALSEADITIVLLMVSVLAGVGSLAAEQIAGRRTSATALRLALLTIAISAGLIGLAPGRPALYAAFALYGLGVGAVDASMNMQGVAIQRIYGRSIMTSFHGVWSIGGIVGALYATGTAALDWSLAGSLGLVAVVGLAATVIAGPSLLEPRRAYESESTVTLDRPPLPWRPILLIGIAVVAFFVVDTAVMSWSSLYIDDALSSPEVLAPLGYAAYQTGGVISRMSGDRFVRRYGAVRVVRAATVMGAVALVAIVVAPTPWLAIGAFALLGLGLPVVVPLSFAAAGSLPGADPDSVIARVNIFNYIGNVLGAALIGAVATAGALRWIFVVPLVLVPVIALVARVFAPTPAIRQLSSHDPSVVVPPSVS